MAIKKSAKTSATKSSILERIAPVSEAEKILTALVYGRPGSGKTVFACTWPKPLLLIDIKEQGSASVSHVSGVDLAPVEQWSEIEELYWMLESGSKYKSVVLDQVSQMQDVLMQSVCRENNIDPTGLMPRRIWGEVSGGLKTWINNFRDLKSRGIHVCMLAHDRKSEGEESEDNQIDPTIGPRVMPSVSSHMGGAVDVIGNTFIRERFIGDKKDRKRLVEYAMRLGPHASYMTKVRKPSESETADIIVNATFDKIMAMSRGEAPAKRTLKK